MDFTETTVEEIDLDTVRPQRAGVILRAQCKDKLYFGMGLDSRSLDITDFGGGVQYKRDKNVVQGALRELNEETLGIFGHIKPSSVGKCPVVYDASNLIIFMNTEYHPQMISTAFEESHLIARWRGTPEVCGIIWLDTYQFHMAIKYGAPHTLFSRVRTFLNKSQNIPSFFEMTTLGIDLTDINHYTRNVYKGRRKDVKCVRLDMARKQRTGERDTLASIPKRIEDHYKEEEGYYGRSIWNGVKDAIRLSS